MCASVRAKEMKHSGTTQSTHSPREPPEVGGMRGKLCLRNEGQSSQRVCEHEVCVHTHRTQNATMPPCGRGLSGSSGNVPLPVREKMLNYPKVVLQFNTAIKK